MENSKNNLTKPDQGKSDKNMPLILSITGLILLLLGLAGFFLFAKNLFTDGIPWIIIATAVLLVVIGIIAIIAMAMKKGKHEPDYYAFFIMGLIWTASGIPLFITQGVHMSSLLFMGVVFFVVGLINKDKWKNRQTWKNLNSKQKKLKIALIIILGIMVLLGLVAYFLVG